MNSLHSENVELQKMLQEYVGENEQLLQQRQAQDSEGVWEQRYQ